MLEKSYIRHLKALMCGIDTSRGQGHGPRFTMCHASLKMALLLHKEGLVKTTVPITVVEGITIQVVSNFFQNLKFLRLCTKDLNFPPILYMQTVPLSAL